MRFTIRSFRARSNAIKAAKLSADNAQEVAEWCNGAIETNARGDLLVEVKIIGGFWMAEPSDYVVEIQKGKFIVMPCEAFEKLFSLTVEELARDGDMWGEPKG